MMRLLFRGAIFVLFVFFLGCKPRFESVNKDSPITLRPVYSFTGIETTDIIDLGFIEKTNQLLICAHERAEDTGGILKIVDIETFVENYTEELYLSSLAVYQDGPYFYGANYTKIIAKKNTGEMLGFIPTEEPVVTIALSSDGELLSVAKPIQSKTIDILSAYTGEKRVRLEKPELVRYTPGTMLFAEDNKALLAHGGPCAYIFKWDVDSGKIIGRYSHRYITRSVSSIDLPKVPKIKDIAISSDGKKMATADNDERIKYWDLEKMETHYIFKTIGSDIQKLFFCYDDLYIIAVTIHTIEIFDLKRSELIYGRYMADYLLEAEWIAPLNTLAVGTYDGKVHLIALEKYVQAQK